jgi:Zn-dependent alcohol dehydrogenase
MKSNAAIAYAAGKPLGVVTVDLGEPKAGEVPGLMDLIATQAAKKKGTLAA